MPDCYVLELSSFQLEILHSHRPVAATVLNISADHLDRHGDVREYAMAKERIYAGGGAMIINLDDERTRRMSQAGRETITFSLNRPEADFTRRRHDGETWLAQGPSLLLRQSELKLRGAHNAANALACLALGQAAGLPMAAMVETLRRFEGLPHRCEWVATHNGVEWFNDSKATNVGATVAALRGFADGQKRVRLIAGGDGKGADFSALAQSLEAHVRSVALIGKSAPRIAAVVAERERVSYAATMQAAVDATMEQARPGDIALLSPACASLDMFENYEDRGNAFQTLPGPGPGKGGGVRMNPRENRFGDAGATPPRAYDVWLAMAALFLLSLGLVMVTSSSITLADRNYGGPLYYFWRQAAALLAGLALGLVIFNIPMAKWEKFSGWLLLAGIALLLLTIAPGIGREVNGSMRWIRLGPVNLQSSEFVKIFVVAYVAAYMVRRAASLRSTFSGFVMPFGVVTLVAALLLLEPDYGSAVIIFLTMLGMLFMGGAPLLRFFGCMLAAAAALGAPGGVGALPFRPG